MKFPEHLRFQGIPEYRSRPGDPFGWFVIPVCTLVPRGLKMMASSGEHWLPVVGYEGLYEVSNCGRVASLPKNIPLPNGGVREQDRQILAPEIMVKGYLRVSLSRGHREQDKTLIHRLVAQAFIPNPKNFEQVNHRDSNPGNNTVGNLEWCSVEYNIHHSIESGRLGRGLTTPEILEIKRLLDSGMSAPDVADQLGRSVENIRDIGNGKHRSLEPEPPAKCDPLMVPWEHVSVSHLLNDVTPTWEEMTLAASLFWDDDETLVQYRPPKSDYVNQHPGCLHWFRWVGFEFPRPPKTLI